MYHEITEADPVHEYQVSRDEFQKQMEYLADSGCQTVTFGDIMKANADSEKSVMITFDDGYKSDLNLALPVLERYGFKSTHFITTGYLGDGKHMDWEEVEELVRRDRDIQSHCASHRSLGELSFPEVEEELRSSKRILEEKLNISLKSVSLPRGSFHPSLPGLAENLGYKYVYSSWPGLKPKALNKNLLMIGRVSMHSSTNMDEFICIVNCEPLMYAKKQLAFMAKKTMKKVLTPAKYQYLWRKIIKKGYE